MTMQNVQYHQLITTVMLTKALF